jgi:hypothetical protein
VDPYVDGLMASTIFASNDLVGCGHMSGLSMRSICPLALMKSDDHDPDHSDELFAHGFIGLFLIFGGDRVVHHVSLRLPNSNL